MLPRRLVVAALVLLGLAAAVLEQSLVHTDDGCELETHCNACLLQLGTRGITTATIPLPRATATADAVVVAVPRMLPGEAPRYVPSRGPPSA